VGSRKRLDWKRTVSVNSNFFIFKQL